MTEYKVTKKMFTTVDELIEALKEVSDLAGGGTMYVESSTGILMDRVILTERKSSFGSSEYTVEIT